MSEQMVNIELVKSPVRAKPEQLATLRALGLRRMHQVVSRKDTRPLRGMLTKVTHYIRLVRVVPKPQGERNGSIVIVKQTAGNI